MEEAEFLANKIVILLNGRVQVVGSVEELFARFCKHITLTFRVGDGEHRTDAIIELLAKKVKNNCVLKGESGSQVEIEIEISDGDSMAVVMGQVFAVMEDNKQMVKEYSVSQPTLNSVFCDIVRKPLYPPR